MKTLFFHPVGLLVFGWLGVLLVDHAEDLITLSGQTYRNVVAVQVEPDGVTWKTENGMCKVDFMDSPEAVRHAYHYDAEKAAAYQEAQAHARAGATDRAQAVLRQNEARQQVRVQQMAASCAVSGGIDGFRYGRNATALSARNERVVGEQFEAFNARERASREEIGTIADPVIWGRIPKPVMLLLTLFAGGGSANQDPRVVGVDSFPKTNYSARDYNDGVDYSDRLLGKKK